LTSGKLTTTIWKHSNFTSTDTSHLTVTSKATCKLLNKELNFTTKAEHASNQPVKTTTPSRQRIYYLLLWGGGWRFDITSLAAPHLTAGESV